MSPSAELILKAEKLCKIYSMGDIVVNTLKFVDPVRANDPVN
jgi:hypothetical protein